MVRTPELIAEVIRALPSPPARRIVLGGAMDDGKEDPVALALSRRGIHGDNTLDPYFNLFMFHRLANDEEWVRAWMDVPLNLHDAGFVAAIDSLVRWRPEKSRRYMDVSQEMSRALEMHPGPVSCLRVDASEFPPPDRLRRWIELLSAKNVQELILLNLTGPEETEAPLHDLRSSRLTKLTVGFLSLRRALPLPHRQRSSGTQESVPTLLFPYRRLQSAIPLHSLSWLGFHSPVVLHGRPKDNLWGGTSVDTAYPRRVTSCSNFSQPKPGASFSSPTWFGDQVL